MLRSKQTDRSKQSKAYNFSKLHYDGDIVGITMDLDLDEDTDRWKKWLYDDNDSKIDDYDDQLAHERIDSFWDPQQEEKRGDSESTKQQKARMRALNEERAKKRIEIMAARVEKDIEADKNDPNYEPPEDESYSDSE